MKKLLFCLLIAVSFSASALIEPFKATNDLTTPYRIGFFQSTNGDYLLTNHSLIFAPTNIAVGASNFLAKSNFIYAKGIVIAHTNGQIIRIAPYSMLGVHTNGAKLSFLFSNSMPIRFSLAFASTNVPGGPTSSSGLNTNPPLRRFTVRTDTNVLVGSGWSQPEVTNLYWSSTATLGYDDGCNTCTNFTITGAYTNAAGVVVQFTGQFSDYLIAINPQYMDLDSIDDNITGPGPIYNNPTNGWHFGSFRYLTITNYYTVSSTNIPVVGFGPVLSAVGTSDLSWSMGFVPPLWRIEKATIGSNDWATVTNLDGETTNYHTGFNSQFLCRVTGIDTTSPTNRVITKHSNTVTNSIDD